MRFHSNLIPTASAKQPIEKLEITYHFFKGIQIAQTALLYAGFGEICNTEGPNNAPIGNAIYNDSLLSLRCHRYRSLLFCRSTGFYSWSPAVRGPFANPIAQRKERTTETARARAEVTPSDS
jgi:hypothetical protein